LNLGSVTWFETIGTISIFTLGLLIFGGFLPMAVFAKSSASAGGNSDVMLLPFASSFAPTRTNMHGFQPAHVINPSGGKYLVPLMKISSDQNTLLSIYRPVTDQGDYVLMKPSDANIKFASMLKSAAGNMGVEYFSLSDIKGNASALKSEGVTFISYDLESGFSPPSDLINPVSSMQEAANVTHQNGLAFMADPSHLLTDKYFSSFAKVSDLYNLQAQAFESNPSNYSTYVHNTIPKLKNAHPGMPVSVETSTARGTVFQMEQCFSLVAGVTDGSNTYYTNTKAGFTALQEYLTWFVSHYG
jgi:hypothetical protein